MTGLIVRHWWRWAREVGVLRSLYAAPLDLACLWIFSGTLGGTLRGQLEKGERDVLG